jgi:ribosomal protein S18 acetylase RimI-like enzyme
LTVRAATPSDARAVRELIDAVAAEADVPILATPGTFSTRDVKARILHTVREPGRLFLVAEVDGRLGGNLDVSPAPFAPSGHVCNLGMSVAAWCRGVGVGSALMETAVAWATGQGYAKLTLSTFPHNTRAVAFYERYGFVREGVRRGQFRRLDRSIDELLMARFLQEAPA